MINQYTNIRSRFTAAKYFFVGLISNDLTKFFNRRDVRVVEGARLESVCRGNSTEGSNPSLSAIFFAEEIL